VRCVKKKKKKKKNKEKSQAKSPARIRFVLTSRSRQLSAAPMTKRNSGRCSTRAHNVRSRDGRSGARGHSQLTTSRWGLVHGLVLVLKPLQASSRRSIRDLFSRVRIYSGVGSVRGYDGRRRGESRLTAGAEEPLLAYL
jgi:hypothetical protein